MLVAGNVVIDRQPGGAMAPGGPALYAARAAAALGVRVSLVTHLPDGFPRELLAGIDVVGPEVAPYPVFENVYGPEGRMQRMEGESLPLDAALEGEPGSAEVLLLAPVFCELTRWPDWDARVRAISLQGALRARDAGMRIHPRADALAAALAFARPGAIVSLSDEDCDDPLALARALCEGGAIVAVTHGDRGATLYTGDGARDYAALPSGPVVDPTGAGDSFATAFVIRYAETGDVEEAMAYGLAAGSIAIEHEGPGAAATRDQLRKRIAGRAA